MKSQSMRSLLPLIFAALCAALFHASLYADVVFTVRQTFSVPDVEKGHVRGWFWMPEDRPGQKVLDFKIIEAPETLQITRDQKYGRSWLYAEARADKAKPLKIVTEFKVLR